MLEQITPLILTYNEAPNIRRTLDKLRWATKVVIIDSGSSDGTIDMLSNYPEVEAFHRPFDDFARQWNYGLSQIASPWVLSLDADYELSDGLVQELSALAPLNRVSGYSARFVYRIWGRSLRGTLYPDRTVLFRRSRAFFRLDGHTQRVIVAGNILPLKGCIYHDDRKSLSRWLTAQQRYACDEAEHLLASRKSELTRTDRLRLRGWPAPFAALFYVLIINRCILDGWAGWYYALQRVVAEMLLALEINDRRLAKERASSSKTTAVAL